MLSAASRSVFGFRTSHGAVSTEGTIGIVHEYVHEVPHTARGLPLTRHAGSDLDSIGFVSKNIKTLKLIANTLLPGEAPVAPDVRPNLICPDPCPLPRPADSAAHSHYSNVVSRLAKILRIDGGEVEHHDIAKSWSKATGNDMGHFEQYFSPVSQDCRDT